MALTEVQIQNKITQHSSSVTKEYSRFYQFAPYTGTAQNNVIVTNKDLSRRKGNRISMPFVPSLANDQGIVGNAQAEGNEEFLDNFAKEVEVEIYRKPVATTEREKQFTVVDLLNEGKERQTDWAKDHMRDQVITALGSIHAQNVSSDQGLAYADASEAQKDAWNTNNSDRLLFGDANANLVAGDQSASLLNITAAMTLNGATLSLLKRRALLATNYRITPLKVKEDMNSEMFVVFVHPHHHRDLWADPVVREDHRQARERSKNNPLHHGGDILYDGMIIRQIQEFGTLGGVGASGAIVAPYYLCGQQALSMAFAKHAYFTSETRDYGHVTGACINIMYNTVKTTYASAVDGNNLPTAYKDFGIATGFASAPADG